MATDVSDLETSRYEVVAIAESYDLTLRVVDFAADLTLDCQVKKTIVCQWSVVLKAMLEGHFREATQNVVPLRDHAARALEIFLCKAHAQDPTPILRQAEDDPSIQLQQLSISTGGNDDTQTLTHRIGEDIFSTADYFQFDIQRMKVCNFAFHNRAPKRFTALAARESMDPKTLAYQMLYPAYKLDDPQAFAFLTRWLVFNTAGSLTELPPDFVRNVPEYVADRVLFNLNAAKASIGTMIEKAVHGIKEVLRGRTRGVYYTKAHRDRLIRINQEGRELTCLDETCNGFTLELARLGLQPTAETLTVNTLSEVIVRLRDFNWRPNNAFRECQFCWQDYRQLIQRIAKKVGNSFHGLCLDCMAFSDPQRGERDWKYWKHTGRKKWCRDCRIRHGRDTWFHSFLGSADDREIEARQAYKRGLPKAQRAVGMQPSIIEIMFTSNRKLVTSGDRRVLEDFSRFPFW